MEELKKALLEAGRVLVLAIIPVAIPMIQEWAIDWKVLAIVAAITLLRFIDKYMHEVGKAKEEAGTKTNPVVSSLTTGLTRF